MLFLMYFPNSIQKQIKHHNKHDLQLCLCSTSSASCTLVHLLQVPQKGLQPLPSSHHWLHVVQLRHIKGPAPRACACESELWLFTHASACLSRELLARAGVAKLGRRAEVARASIMKARASCAACRCGRALAASWGGSWRCGRGECGLRAGMRQHRQ